jgi:hypothetical protein
VPGVREVGQEAITITGGIVFKCPGAFWMICKEGGAAKGSTVVGMFGIIFKVAEGVGYEGVFFLSKRALFTHSQGVGCLGKGGEQRCVALVAEELIWGGRGCGAGKGQEGVVLWDLSG